VQHQVRALAMQAAGDRRADSFAPPVTSTTFPESGSLMA